MSNTTGCSPKFDEQLYLRMNEDVRLAIARGDFASGHEHYLAYGCRENRLGVAWDGDDDDDAPRIHHPAPPESLRRRVHGDGRLSGFLKVGQALASDIAGLVPDDLSLDAESRILDFGCGCGRVALFARARLPGRFDGTDIDHEAIGWCASHLHDVATFSANGVWPPLPFQDGTFDLIYSISIFTHLPEDMQIAWLRELSRVLKDGGCALLTVHGDHRFPASHVTALERQQFMTSGFHYLQGHATDGLPVFYGSAVHAEPYVRSHWSRFFTIERIVPRGANQQQDVVVCRSLAWTGRSAS